MIQKLLSKLKRKPKMTDEEFNFGKWICTKCEMTFDGLELARLHFKEKKYQNEEHPVFPYRYWRGSHRF